ncbi:MAG: hypothetical protein H8E71_04085 [Candidatus Marinimicrobia bacterium]|nr:hypothetical protein [Candidatus Neomarinimicrobiota bacterium]
MAGFSRLYCIGGLGGFMGADGINPIAIQILVGDADRQWLEPHYFDKSIKPIGNIKSIIPEGPGHQNMLIDSCIAFAPVFFKKCPTLSKVEIQLEGYTRLDFNLEIEKIPDEWGKLRKEAVPFFRSLNIFEAELKPLLF